MTSKGEDPLNDEFEAFLAGEGELARQLSALRQPESPQRLNDAIMAAAEARMAPEQATRRVAANDVGPAVAPVLRPSFTTRWRVPAAMAASVIGAVLLMLEWQRGDYAPPDRTAMREQAKVAAVPTRIAAEASAPALARAPEPEPARERASFPSGQPPAPVRAKPAAAAMAKAADKASAPSHAPVERGPTPFIAKEREESLAYAPSPPPPPAPAVPAQERMALVARRAPAPMIALPAPAPMAFSPAPAIAPPPPPTAAAAAAPISVTGSAARSAIAPANDPKAAAWLNVIDEMLKADLRKDALDEWKKFRLAYPDYPVPEALAKRIAALD